jgi:tetratricopeptide (TPR) repeat protein
MDEAMQAFQRAVELNPSTARAYDGIGHIHYRIGSPPREAIAAYERGIANDPHYIYNFYGLSILHSAKLGEYDLAMQALQRGLAANPADPFLTANLGCTYARMGQIEKGIEILEQVTKLDPNQAFAHSWLALLYLHLQRFDESARACQRENEIDDNASSHRLLGYIHHAQGQNDQAIAELEQAVAMEPGDYEARGALALVYRESGDLKAGDAHYQAALDMALQDNEYGQACFHAVSGNVEKALDLLEIGVAKGQVEPGWIRIDPEFAFIQAEPRFQALIAREEP